MAVGGQSSKRVFGRNYIWARSGLGRTQEPLAVGCAWRIPPDQLAKLPSCALSPPRQHPHSAPSSQHSASSIQPQYTLVPRIQHLAPCRMPGPLFLPRRTCRFQHPLRTRVSAIRHPETSAAHSRALEPWSDGAFCHVYSFITNSDIAISK